MGGATSAQFFSYVLDTILRDIKGQKAGTWRGPGDTNGKKEVFGVYNYLDDIIIFSETARTQMRLLKQVLARLVEFGLRAKLSKTHVGYTELRFLGRIVSEKGVRIDKERIKPLLEMRKPTGRQAKTQLRAIIGGANYYNSYIRHYAEVMEPLFRLLKKDVNVVQQWGKEQEDTLTLVKRLLTTAPILAYPDPDRQFILKTDASKNFIGGVLSQKDKNGRDQVIEYTSSTLTLTQRAYGMHEKECYAVVAAFHKHRVYLEGKTDTLVYTDSQSIVFLRANKYEDMSGRLIRWFQFLGRFTFQMIFRKGTDNTDADMLTRAFEDDLSDVKEDTEANWIYEPLFKHLRGKGGQDQWHELKHDG
jgi:hypothetical protein